MPVVDPPATGEQPQAIRKPRLQPVQPGRRVPGGGQLDRQRHSVQGPTNAGDALDERRIVGPHRTPARRRPPQEQLDRVARATVLRFDRQAGHLEDALERHQQPGAAGREHPRPRTAGQQAFHQDLNPVQQVLTVVQDEQGLSVAQPAQHTVCSGAARTFTEAKHIGDRWRNHQRIGHRHEIDIPDTVSEPITQISGDTPGQTRLADPTRPHRRDQSVLVQRNGQRRPLRHPAHERRQRRRQHSRNGDRSAS